MEKGMLFSTPLVQVIQNLKPNTWPAEPIDPGKPWKWQTRRLDGLREINKEPDNWTLQSFEQDPELAAWDKNGDMYPRVEKGLIATFEHNEFGEWFCNTKCPYPPGTIIWVRETWKYYEKAVGKGESFHVEQFLAHKADEDNSSIKKPSEWYEGKWRPSIHMPREAARLFLEAVSVEPQRVQDITEDDARAEGVKGIPRSRELYPIDDYIYPFKSLWDSIYQKRGYGWDMNPWVWKIVFKRVTI